VDSFPEDVKQFFEQTVDSVEQLEILRILGEDPYRQWSQDEISHKIQSNSRSTQEDISALEQRGLLKCVLHEGRTMSQLGAQSPELEALTNRLLELYRQRPVTMIRMVYERKLSVLRHLLSSTRIEPTR
jgi:hypothetical protein